MVTKEFQPHTELKAADLNELASQINSSLTQEAAAREGAINNVNEAVASEVAARQEAEKKKSTIVDIYNLRTTGAILPLNGAYVFNGLPVHGISGHFDGTGQDFIAFCVAHEGSDEIDHTIQYYLKSGNDYKYAGAFDTSDTDTPLEVYIAQSFSAYPATETAAGLMSSQDKKTLNGMQSQIDTLGSKVDEIVGFSKEETKSISKSTITRQYDIEFSGVIGDTFDFEATDESGVLPTGAHVYFDSATSGEKFTFLCGEKKTITAPIDFSKLVVYVGASWVDHAGDVTFVISKGAITKKIEKIENAQTLLEGKVQGLTFRVTTIEDNLEDFPDLANKGYKFGGVVKPSDSPLDTNVAMAYFASENGVYPNFGNITIDNEIAAFVKGGSAEVSPNLLDLNALIDGVYINDSSGAEEPYVNWSASPYIKIEAGKSYKCPRYENGTWVAGVSVYYGVYDSDKNCTKHGRTASGKTTIATSDGDVYIRVSFANTRIAQQPMLVPSDYNVTEYIEPSSGGKWSKMVISTKNNDEGNTKLGLAEAKILVPSTLAFMTNKEFLIQIPNILYGYNAKNVFARTTGSLPLYAHPQWLRAKPTSAGTKTGTIHLYCSRTQDAILNDSIVSISTKTITAKIIDAQTAGAGQTKRVLVIGDSQTAPGSYIRIARQMFQEDVMNVDFIGTMGYSAIHIDESGAIVNTNGQVLTDNWRYTDNREIFDITSGQILQDKSGDNMTLNHEGHGGWSAEAYCTLRNYNGYFNAFFNPTTSKFDFSYYMNHYGFSGVDYVFICLGGNDTGKYGINITSANLDTIISYYNEIIASIKLYNPNAKICIGLCVMPAENEYTSTDTIANRVPRQILVERLLSLYDKKESENLFIFPMGFPIDPYRDFETEDKPLSDRDPQIVKKVKDMIHPNTAISSGKLADVLQTYIKYLATL